MIQIQRLEGFYWVAFTGGYARAARAFPYPISQPAVHQQVSKLQRELETTLFERVAKDRVRLTPAGRHLFDFVAPFYEGLPAVVRSLKGAEHGGEIHIQAASLLPGFDFNNQPLGNSGSDGSLATSGTVAGQGLTNLDLVGG